jgi:hypothetical protein
MFTVVSTLCVRACAGASPSSNPYDVTTTLRPLNEEDALDIPWDNLRNERDGSLNAAFKVGVFCRPPASDLSHNLS